MTAIYPAGDTVTMTNEPAKTIHPIVRILIGSVTAAAAAGGAFVTWFIAIVTFTGCFISCGDPNEPGGLALMGLTAVLVGLFVAGVGYAVIGWAKERLFRLWLIGAGVGAILGIASLAAS